MGDRGIHQALHGYAGGHRLLASSIELPPQSRETMAALSDLSGTRPYEGFDSYLTAYPLPHTDYFVLARTWIAPEMPRPGCVWTHSLLIPTTTLGSLAELFGLLHLHVRPEPGDVSEYTRQLDLPQIGTGGFGPAPRVDLLRRVLIPLYSSPRQVVVASSDSRSFERETIAIWSQQWAELRASFLFCTGSLAPRALHGRQFDLQVMPAAVARAATHDRARNMIVVDVNESPALSARPDSEVAMNPPFRFSRDWTEVAAADLELPGGVDGFRDWAALAGLAAGGGRDTAGLCFTIASELVADPPALVEAVAKVAQAFPEPETAHQLKNAMIGSDSPLREFDVLAFLATSSLPAAFSNIDLHLRQRGSSLAHSNPLQADALLRLLADTSVSEHGSDILVGLAIQMPAEDLVTLASRHRGILYEAILANPSLLAHNAIWRTTGAAAESVAALASVSDDFRPDPEALLYALGGAPSEILDQVSKVYGVELLKAALGIGERDPDRLVDLLTNPPLMRLVGEHAAITRSWISNHHPSLGLARRLAQVISPADMATVPMRHWISILPPRAQPNDLHLYASLFAMAMSADSQDAGALAGRTFAALHRAADTSTLPDHVWWVVAQRLPGVPGWMEWDHCERMRRGYAQAFVGRKPWKFADFVVAFENDDATLRLVCDFTRSWDRGRKFLRRLSEAIDAGRVRVSDSQRRIIEEAGRKTLSDYLSL